MSESLPFSGREERNAHAEACRAKMASILAEQWLAGERWLVKSTIDCALDCHMSRQWKDDTAAALPVAEREPFFSYMRGQQ